MGNVTDQCCFDDSPKNSSLIKQESIHIVNKEKTFTTEVNANKTEDIKVDNPKRNPN